MAASAEPGDDGIVGINVTPLVDIMLVLLIIFMVTARLIVSSAVPLDLPKAASAGETQTVFVVSIDDKGVVRADGREAKDDGTLRAAARAALQKTRELRTVIHASRAATHGAVLHVLDVLRLEGVTKVAFGAEKTL
ncbi:MAG: biopolymer transporter ExbD [Deltaproteobacteria bacterium]|nr:biopolymer transporter ExbD [Deltaproteobacteria bacterium]